MLTGNSKLPQDVSESVNSCLNVALLDMQLGRHNSVTVK